ARSARAAIGSALRADRRGQLDQGPRLGSAQRRSRRAGVDQPPRQSRRGRAPAVKHVRFSLLLVLLAACAPDALVETRGELEVEPGEIDFGRVWIGDPAERPVSFQNRGRARIDVELTVGVPFTLDETRFSLDGGASRVVRV